MQADVIAAGQVTARERQRTVAIGLGGERVQRDAHFGRLEALEQADRTEMMAVEDFGKTTQHRVLGVGRDAFDDQLMPRDAKGNQGAIAQQALHLPRHPLGRGPERGVAQGIHRVLVQRDRQLDQQLGELTRRRCARARRGGVGHRPPI